MLPALPPQLKFASSTLARGQELESKEPIIAHYCRLHAAQQILAKGLHQNDPEVAKFATALLDQIETSKSGQDPDSPLSTEQAQSILNDEQTANAYVENFALNVFAKADADIYNKQSNKVTASKFMAAAVFLDVLKVFQDQLDSNITEKIKYSKFQASRILKAIKNGQDPNDYEPPGEKTQEDELEELEHEQNEQKDQGQDQDEEESDIPKLPAAPPTLPKTPENKPKGTPTRMLPGGPPVPSAPTWLPDDNNNDDDDNKTDSPDITPNQPPQDSKQQHFTPTAPPIDTTTNTKPITKDDVQTIVDQNQLVNTAQKHAKFAISALNYDDKYTAIKELEKALRLLKNQ